MIYVFYTLNIRLKPFSILFGLDLSTFVAMLLFTYLIFLINEDPSLDDVE